ncbi:MAG: hypothetical protein ACTSU2_14685 [Promethearchaeota archaeon]
MKTYNLTKEIDYYDFILRFYEEINEKKKKDKGAIELWSDKSIINLMHDLKQNKKLSDAEIRDVIKNSLILILDLFDEKCQRDPNKPLEALSDKDKANIRKILLKVLE